MTGYRKPYPFVQASGFTAVGSIGKKRDVALVVIHDMESAETDKTAEAVAAYFANGAGGRQVSSHYCIDSDSIIQCVREDDVAWCAPGSNHNGVQLEHAGRASQSFEQWLDAYGQSMLDLSARLTAQICLDYHIPIRYINWQGLKNGMRGITTHRDVSLAFRRTDHTDPGKEFPMYWYVRRAAYWSGRLSPETAPQDETPWPLPIPAWFWKWAQWHLQGRKQPRPDTPEKIPQWAWVRLEALVAGRNR